MAQAASWGDRPEATVKSEVQTKHASSKTTVKEVVGMHLKAQLEIGESLQNRPMTFVL